MSDQPDSTITSTSRSEAGGRDGGSGSLRRRRPPAHQAESSDRPAAARGASPSPEPDSEAQAEPARSSPVRQLAADAASSSDRDPAVIEPERTPPPASPSDHRASNSAASSSDSMPPGETFSGNHRLSGEGTNAASSSDSGPVGALSVEDRPSDQATSSDTRRRDASPRTTSAGLSDAASSSDAQSGAVSMVRQTSDAASSSELGVGEPRPAAAGQASDAASSSDAGQPTHAPPSSARSDVPDAASSSDSRPMFPVRHPDPVDAASSSDTKELTVRQVMIRQPVDTASSSDSGTVRESMRPTRSPLDAASSSDASPSLLVTPARQPTDAAASSSDSRTPLDIDPTSARRRAADGGAASSSDSAPPRRTAADAASPADGVSSADPEVGTRPTPRSAHAASSSDATPRRPVADGTSADAGDGAPSSSQQRQRRPQQYEEVPCEPDDGGGTAPLASGVHRSRHDSEAEAMEVADDSLDRLPAPVPLAVGLTGDQPESSGDCRSVPWPRNGDQQAAISSSGASRPRATSPTTAQHGEISGSSRSWPSPAVPISQHQEVSGSATGSSRSPAGADSQGGNGSFTPRNARSPVAADSEAGSGSSSRSARSPAGADSQVGSGAVSSARKDSRSPGHAGGADSTFSRAGGGARDRGPAASSTTSRKRPLLVPYYSDSSDDDSSSGCSSPGGKTPRLDEEISTSQAAGGGPSGRRDAEEAGISTSAADDAADLSLDDSEATGPSSGAPALPSMAVSPAAAVVVSSAPVTSRQLSDQQGSEAQAADPGDDAEEVVSLCDAPEPAVSGSSDVLPLRAPADVDADSDSRIDSHINNDNEAARDRDGVEASREIPRPDDSLDEDSRIDSHGTDSVDNADARLDLMENYDSRIDSHDNADDSPPPGEFGGLVSSVGGSAGSEAPQTDQQESCQSSGDAEASGSPAGAGETPDVPFSAAPASPAANAVSEQPADAASRSSATISTATTEPSLPATATTPAVDPPVTATTSASPSPTTATTSAPVATATITVAVSQSVSVPAVSVHRLDATDTSSQLPTNVSERSTVSKVPELVLSASEPSCPAADPVSSGLETPNVVSASGPRAPEIRASTASAVKIPDVEPPETIPDAELSSVDTPTLLAAETMPPCPAADTDPPCPDAEAVPPCPAAETVPPCPDAETGPPCPTAEAVPPCPAAETVPPCPAAETVPPCPAAETVPPCSAAETGPPCPAAETVPPCPAAETVSPYPAAETAPPCQAVGIAPPCQAAETAPPCQAVGTAPPCPAVEVTTESSHVLEGRPDAAPSADDGSDVAGSDEVPAAFATSDTTINELVSGPPASQADTATAPTPASGAPHQVERVPDSAASVGTAPASVYETAELAETPAEGDAPQVAPTTTKEEASPGVTLPNVNDIPNDSPPTSGLPETVSHTSDVAKMDEPKMRGGDAKIVEPPSKETESNETVGGSEPSSNVEAECERPETVAPEDGAAAGVVEEPVTEGNHKESSGSSSGDLESLAKKQTDVGSDQTTKTREDNEVESAGMPAVSVLESGSSAKEDTTVDAAEDTTGVTAEAIKKGESEKSCASVSEVPATITTVNDASAVPGVGVTKSSGVAVPAVVSDDNLTPLSQNASESADVKKSKRDERRPAHASATGSVTAAGTSKSGGNGGRPERPKRKVSREAGGDACRSSRRERSPRGEVAKSPRRDPTPKSPHGSADLAPNSPRGSVEERQRPSAQGSSNISQRRTRRSISRDSGPEVGAGKRQSSRESEGIAAIDAFIQDTSDPVSSAPVLQYKVNKESGKEAREATPAVQKETVDTSSESAAVDGASEGPSVATAAAETSSTSTTAATGPVKRRRGRPRKNPIPNFTKSTASTPTTPDPSTAASTAAPSVRAEVGPETASAAPAAAPAPGDMPLRKSGRPRKKKLSEDEREELDRLRLLNAKARLAEGRTRTSSASASPEKAAKKEEDEKPLEKKSRVKKGKEESKSAEPEVEAAAPVAELVTPQSQAASTPVASPVTMPVKGRPGRKRKQPELQPTIIKQEPPARVEVEQPASETWQVSTESSTDVTVQQPPLKKIRLKKDGTPAKPPGPKPKPPPAPADSSSYSGSRPEKRGRRRRGEAVPPPPADDNALMDAEEAQTAPPTAAKPPPCQPAAAAAGPEQQQSPAVPTYTAAAAAAEGAESADAGKEERVFDLSSQKPLTQPPTAVTEPASCESVTATLEPSSTTSESPAPNTQSPEVNAPMSTAVATAVTNDSSILSAPTDTSATLMDTSNTSAPAAVAEEPAAVTEEPAAVTEEPAAVAEEPAAVAEEPARPCPVPSATQLVEYHWPREDASAELFVVQEHLAVLLDIRAFQLRFPDLPGRPIDADERAFLLEQVALPEPVTSRNQLTAVRTSDVTELLLRELPDQADMVRRLLDSRRTLASAKPQASPAEQERARLQALVRQAARQAAAWNAQLNRDRRDERRASLDLQTYTVHYPQRRRPPPAAPRLGHYPVAVLPGQYTDYYRRYTGSELMYLPVNTVLGTRTLEDLKSDGSDSEGAESAHEENSSVSGEPAPRVDTQPSELDRGPDPHARPGAVCRVCNGAKHGPLLLHCSKCESSAHPQCLELSENMVARLQAYPWQCMECKTCGQCDSADDEDKMIFCDFCDRGYHIYCVGLRRVPTGRWHCVKCARCQTCGTTDPTGGLEIPELANRAPEWAHQYRRRTDNVKVYVTTLCIPCDRLWKKYKYCPICFKCYRKPEDHDMVTCSTCNKWVHKECIKSLGFSGAFVCHDCQEKRQQTMHQNLKNAGQLARRPLAV